MKLYAIAALAALTTVSAKSPTPYYNTWVTTTGQEAIAARGKELDDSFGVTGADSWSLDPLFLKPSDLGEKYTVEGKEFTVSHHSLECKVTDWHPASACSVECGGGIKTRPHKASTCPFDVFHQQCCNTQPCATDECPIGSFVSKKATVDV